MKTIVVDDVEFIIDSGKNSLILKEPNIYDQFIILESPKFLEKIYNKIKDVPEINKNKSINILVGREKMTLDKDYNINKVAGLQELVSDLQNAINDIKSDSIPQMKEKVKKVEEKSKQVVDELNKIETSASKMTEDAQKFISDKIKILMDEGYDQEQAIAIAYDMARKKGYDVSEKKADLQNNINVVAEGYKGDKKEKTEKDKENKKEEKKDKEDKGNKKDKNDRHNEDDKKNKEDKEVEIKEEKKDIKSIEDIEKQLKDLLNELDVKELNKEDIKEIKSKIEDIKNVIKELKMSEEKEVKDMEQMEDKNFINEEIPKLEENKDVDKIDLNIGKEIELPRMEEDLKLENPKIDKEAISKEEIDKSKETFKKLPGKGKIPKIDKVSYNIGDEVLIKQYDIIGKIVGKDNNYYLIDIGEESPELFTEEEISSTGKKVDKNLFKNNKVEDEIHAVEKKGGLMGNLYNIVDVIEEEKINALKSIKYAEKINEMSKKSNGEEIELFSGAKGKLIKDNGQKVMVEIDGKILDIFKTEIK